MLGDFFSQGVAQLNLFDDNAPRPGSEQLMAVMDTLNAKEGRGTLYFAGQGIQQQWQMKRAMLSPRYTTRSLIYCGSNKHSGRKKALPQER